MVKKKVSSRPLKNSKKKSLKKSKVRSPRSKLGKDFEQLVGSDVYSVWLRMLKELVPSGRTHRLAVLVAGMLQYACCCQIKASKENTAFKLLDQSAEIGMDYDDQGKLIIPLIEQIFKDSGVKWKRKNARGRSYSIAEQSLDEFLRWEFMPWE